jgi:tetratricopeptide (TPR) repeat protein
MRKIGILLFMVLISAGLTAQNSKITTGVLSVNDRDFEAAIEQLTTGLSDHSALKEKNIPKGYINLAVAYQNAATAEATKAKYPDGLMLAYDAYKKAVDNQGYADKPTQRLINNSSLLLKNAIYNEAATAYNEGSNATETAAQAEKFTKAASHFKAACEMDKADYNARVMMGYSNLMLKDTTTAVASLKEAINMYKNLDPAPEKPDANIGSAFIQGSLLNMYQGNVREALDLVAIGKDIFKGEDEAEKKVADNLDRVALAIYSQNPDLFTEARKEFEKAIEADPSDVEVKLAYAGLLAQREEQEDKDYSLKLYREILETDADNYQANANVGVFYINEAAAKSTKMMADETSEEEVAALEKGIIESLRSAYPYIVKAHEAKPDFLEWVNQLVNITSYVPEYLGELTKWTTIQRELIAKNSGN